MLPILAAKTEIEVKTLLERSPQVKIMRMLGLIGPFLLCGLGSAQAQEPNPWVDAFASRNINGTAAPGQDSVAADASFTGSWAWGIGMYSHYSISKPSPKITVNSALTGVTATWNGSPYTSFPLVAADAELPAGAWFGRSIDALNVQHTFQPGYESSRTVSPAVVPPGGIDQTVTVKIRFTNASRWTAGPGGNFFGTLGVDIHGQCVTRTAWVPPADGPVETGYSGGCDDQHVYWAIQWDNAVNKLTIGQEYTFTAVMRVENGTPLPVVKKPAIQLTPAMQYPFSSETSTTAAIWDEVLSGNIYFELGASVLWANRTKEGEGFQLNYLEFEGNPEIEIQGLPAACTLWPPNHKLVPVAIVRAVDTGSGVPSLTVTGESNEPDNGLGDGDTPNDILITPSDVPGFYVVQLRAERSGTGTGRVYTIKATATDVSGNTDTKTATCAVPHNK
jgi:hypothetical protein